jgi:hypothetical protein
LLLRAATVTHAYFTIEAKKLLSLVAKQSASPVYTLFIFVDPDQHHQCRAIAGDFRG